MKEVSLSDIKKNLTHYIGKGTKLQFSNKPEWYYFDNFSADTVSLFCKKEDGSWANRKINNITKIYNTEPIIIKEGYTIVNDKEIDKIKDNFKPPMKENKEEEMKLGIDIEKEHKGTYEKIKAYYEEHNKMPPEDDVYDWIAEEHIEEFKKYYSKGLIPMEKKLEKEKEGLKEHTITNDKQIDSIKDKFNPPGTLTEDGPINIDQEATPEPEVTDVERKQIIIDVRQEIESLISGAEGILLNEENFTMLPPRINAITRISEVLKSLKALRNDLDASSTIIQESAENQDEIGEETEEEKDDDNTNDKKKSILLGYKKSDVNVILDNNFKVLQKESNDWKISVRNPFRESTSSLLNYTMNVFFDDNCVVVTPNIISEETEKLAEKILKEIYEDLTELKSNKYILSENTLSDWDIKANDILVEVLANPTNIKKIEEVYETGTLEDQVAEMENGESKIIDIIYDIDYTLKNENQVSIKIKESYDVTVNNSTSYYGTTDTTIAPESNGKEDLISKSWIEVLYDGSSVELTPENKQLLDNKFNI